MRLAKVDAQRPELAEAARLKAESRARTVARVRHLLAEGLTPSEVARSIGRSPGCITDMRKRGEV